MLDKKDYIRIDHYYPPNGNGGRKNVYVFKCKTCDGEVRARSGETLVRHSGSCSKCAFVHIGEMGRIQRLRDYECLYNIFISKKYNKNIPSDVTYEEFVEFTKISECHYCGTTINWERLKTGASSKGGAFNLDRKDNKRGHVIDNLVVCCFVCNMLKSAIFTYEEFLLFSPILRQIRKSRKEWPSNLHHFRKMNLTDITIVDIVDK